MFFKLIILALSFEFIYSADTRLGASKGYKLEYFFKTDWYNANLFCRYHGLQLASMETAEQQAYVGKLIVDLGYASEYFWLSGSNFQQDGKWSWFGSGNLFQYTNWYPKEPNNAKGVEHCLQTYKEQKWNDESCVGQYYFICEIPYCT